MAQSRNPQSQKCGDSVHLPLPAASLWNYEMRGSADLLRRIDRPLLLGNWSYIPIECKLANKPKTTFLVQASAYCELLTLLLGQRPDQFELYLGGGKFQPYGIDQFWAWFQLLRQRYYQFQKSFNPAVVPEDAPGDHCSWSTFIEQRLEVARDLMLVANMRQSQCQRLRAAGVYHHQISGCCSCWHCHPRTGWRGPA